MKPCLERAVPALQVLKLDGQMLELAEELKMEQSLLVFGRGYNYATALEAALKVCIALPSAIGLRQPASVICEYGCMDYGVFAQTKHSNLIHTGRKTWHSALSQYSLAYNCLPGFRVRQRYLPACMIWLVIQERECWSQVKEVALMHSEGPAGRGDEARAAGAGRRAPAAHRHRHTRPHVRQDAERGAPAAGAGRAPHHPVQHGGRRDPGDLRLAELPSYRGVHAEI